MISGSARPFRRDVEGLRAVAVLMVVLFHAGVPGFRGGFVGVDVFFVISGFLITQLLVDELEGTGRIRLRGFWARRARRLLPAASLVIACVLVATMFIATPLDWKPAVTAALATTTYWSNHLFARQSVDYFMIGAHPSPLLHTWSLAVEEQFYLLWPPLLLAAGWLASRSRISPRRVCALVIATVTFASLATSMALTQRLSPLAFFGAPSRAWELGTGALLALATPTLARIQPTWRWALGTTGAAALVFTVATYNNQTVFPGRAALLPVLGAAGVLAAGIGGAWRGAGVLETAPARYIGRVSYSWYLWHWPVLVLGAEYFHNNGATARYGLAATSFVPAVLTHHLLENPLRHNRRLAVSPGATVRLAAGFAATVLACSAVVWLHADAVFADPTMAMVASAHRAHPPLPDTCASTDVATLEAHCASGDLHATKTVLVIGDSKAAQWVPGLSAAARIDGLRLVTSTQGSCPAVGYGTGDARPSCIARLNALPTLLAQLHPDLVAVGDSANYVGELLSQSGQVIPQRQQLGAWSLAHEQLAARLKAMGIGMLDLLDVPQFHEDPLDCITRTRDVAACQMSAAAATRSVAAVHRAELDGMAAAAYGSAFDPVTLLCGDESCPLVEDGVIVYHDGGHITSTYSARQAGRLALLLRTAVTAPAS